MKRLVSAVLALSLLGTTAAVAAPYGNGDYGNRDNYRGHGDGNGAAIVAGVGLVALAAILASQHHHHWHRGWYGNDGYSYGYNGGYGYDGYGHNGGYGYNGAYGYNGDYGNAWNHDNNRGYGRGDGDHRDGGGDHERR
jgi:hypothetical protein